VCEEEAWLLSPLMSQCRVIRFSLNFLKSYRKTAVHIAIGLAYVLGLFLGKDYSCFMTLVVCSNSLRRW